MEWLCDVLLPGPWWHPLTYTCTKPVDRGCRVRVPVGRGERTGVVIHSVLRHEGHDENAHSFRPIAQVLDTTPVVSDELLQTLQLTGKHFLCGAGELMKIAFPAPFFAGEPADSGHTDKPETAEGLSIRFHRNPLDKERFALYEKYLDEGEGNGCLVLFPERRQAERFWGHLGTDLREKGILWPPGTGKRVWEAWKKCLSGEYGIVVGSMGALFAPLKGIGYIIVEDEGSPAYYTRRFPFIHARSVLTYRAKYWDAELVLGGAMPSSRTFLYQREKSPDDAKGRVVFADQWAAREFDVRGVSHPLNVTDTVLSRTQNVVADRGTALWLLDRIGYASGIWCHECGHILGCKKCGTALRWESRESLAVCPFCQNREVLPETCPKCGGLLMEGLRPGIEASAELASNLLGDTTLVHEWHGAQKREKSRRRELLKTLNEKGGIVTGSRKALELCDDVPVNLVCWLDMDMELLRPSYDVKYKTFRMVWESLWRGIEPKKRIVVLQTRRPRTGWQKGLEKGWHLFWEAELSERKELSLPPWQFLVEIHAGNQIKDETLSILERAGFECLDPEPGGDLFWVRTKRTEPLRKALEPLFSVSRSRQGFPRVKVWVD